MDTSAYSNFQRSKPEALDVVSRAERIGLPSVVIGELEVGFRRGTRYNENSAQLNEFINYHSVEVLPVTRQISEVFAEIYVELTRTGRSMPTNDVWIAATCAGFGSTLISYDNHFRYIERIGKLILLN